MIDRDLHIGGGTKAERIVWVDWAKTILIWFMVMGHAGLSGQPRTIVYSFHMPAFFIISGFLFKPKKIYRYLKMFVPVVVFSTLIVGLIVGKGVILEEKHFAVKDILDLYYHWDSENGYFRVAFPGLWFVVALFWTYCLMSVTFIRENSVVFGIISAAIAIYLAAPHSCLGIVQYSLSAHLFEAFPFFVVGNQIKERKFDIKKIPNWSLPFLLAIFLEFAFNNGAIEMCNSTFGTSYATFFAIAVLGSIIMFKLLSFLPSCDVITIISTGTLFILGFHSIVLSLIRYFINLQTTNNIISIIVSLVILLIAYPIINFIKTVPILLGK